MRPYKALRGLAPYSVPLWGPSEVRALARGMVPVLAAVLVLALVLVH